MSHFLEGIVLYHTWAQPHKQWRPPTQHTRMGPMPAKQKTLLPVVPDPTSDLMAWFPKARARLGLALPSMKVWLDRSLSHAAMTRHWTWPWTVRANLCNFVYQNRHISIWKSWKSQQDGMIHGHLLRMRKLTASDRLAHVVVNSMTLQLIDMCDVMLYITSYWK